MGLLSGATSLVELVLKKYGDDTAGAAKELERLGGFPEPVAQRIASGELPMDAASVDTRRGLFEDAEGFHGSTHDLKNFDGSATNVDNDFGQGTYITDDSYDASVNYAGEGADLTNRLERHVEMNEFQDFMGDDDVRYIGGKDWTGSEWDELTDDQRRGFLLSDARDEIKGGNQGILYPVSVNHDGVVNSTDSIRDSIEMKDWDDYLTEAAEDLEPSYKGETVQSLLDPDGEYYDELQDLASEMQYSDETSPNMIAYDVMRRYGLDEGTFELDHLDTWQDLRDVMDDKIGNGWYPQGDDGEMLTSGGVLSEVMQELGLKGYNDMSSASRFSGMEGGAGNHTIMFPGSENQIRSVNAAFDPTYSGPNIMGGAAGTAGLAGLLAAGQSEDSEAGFITKGGKTLLEAWHGSPHKFDKFSMDSIGSGEGAQAYGHGLYFTDSEDIARGYKSKLEKGGGLSDDDTMARILNSVDGDTEKAVAELRRRGNASLQGETPENAKRFFQMAQRVDGGHDPRGALYRTEIDVTPESLLDLDKPLNNQSDYVQERLQGIMGETWNKKKESWTGRDYQRNWFGDYGDGLTSDQLLENGILGNRYRDGDHRGKFTGRTMRDGQPYSDDVTFPDERSRLQWKAEKEAEGFDVELDEGSSNYVIFDDSLINIAERGNADPRLLAGTAAGAAGLLAAPALMKDEPVDPTAPLPAPAFGEQMGKAGEVLMTILDAPITGWQGIARGLSGVMNGEDVVTAGAEANHMMNGGSEEGFDRLGDKVEGLLGPIDKRFPYLNAGKSAGDTVALLASLFAPF